MSTDTATAIIRAAAALVRTDAGPIIENLELVQDMAESAAAYMTRHDAPAGPLLMELDGAGRDMLAYAIERFDCPEPEQEAVRGRLRDELAAMVAPPAAPNNWLHKMPRDLHAWLIDEVGMEPELAGGGCVMLRHVAASGAYVLVTDSGGTGLPSADEWCVGAYPPGADGAEEAMLVLYSTERPSPLARPLTLRQAVAAACSVVAEYEVPAAPEARALELGAALVRDALALLDVVDHCDDSALEDGKLRVITEDGRVLRVSVEVLEGGE